MPSIKLSVNVNKVATLRNSRGGREPDVLEAVASCIRAGAPGITVHPRADQRHITPPRRVRRLRELLKSSPEVEFNIEGDPRPDLLELVLKVRPTQCTLVPVQPGEITSQAGWPADTPVDELSRNRQPHQETRRAGQPLRRSTCRSCAMGRGRGRRSHRAVHRAFCPRIRSRREVTRASRHTPRRRTSAHSLGLGVNAGHDLDLKNLPLFRRLPHLQEVSIGHALVSHALYVGLERSVRDYLDALR